MAQVKLENVCKSYDKTEVIRNLDLTVNEREFIVLVGPSGCGKSTVLRMIAGLESLTGGNILINDRIVNDMAPKDRDIAMVFQSYALYPHMSVYDNMAFGLKMRKTPKADIRQKVEEVAKILDLTQLLTRKPRQLSGGQRQRVALGRAIVRNPKVFLMDEPLSNLDAKLRVQMRTEIQKLHRNLRATTIYVTHDQVEAMTMGERIVILHEGIIQQVGEPAIVYSQPRNLFVGGFIGNMYFIEANYENGKVHLESGQQWLIPADVPESRLLNTLGQNSKRIELGIRPEHFLPFNQSGNISNLQSLTIIPEIIEVLGHEKVLHFTLENKPMSASIPPDAEVFEGKPLNLNLRLDKISYFNSVTKQNILETV